jgi:hypothetical protein
VRVVNVKGNRFGLTAFILHLFNQLLIAIKLICSICEATTGSLPEASSA